MKKDEDVLLKVIALLILAMLGLVVELIYLHDMYKLYVELFFRVMAFVTSIITLYQFIKSRF
jgi:hypothetical protein